MEYGENLAGVLPPALRQLRQFVPVKGKVPGKGWNVKQFALREVLAMERSTACTGVGIVLTGITQDGRQLVCLDFDKVLTEAQEFPEDSPARALLDKLKGITYVERSASGRGYHAFLWVSSSLIPQEAQRLRVSFGGKLEAADTGFCNGVEVYTGSGGAKQIALTGRAEGVSAVAGGDDIARRILDMMAEQAKGRPAGGADERQAEPRDGHKIEPLSPGVDMSAAAVIDRIQGSRQAFDFAALYTDGDLTKYGGDHSAADYALLSILYFWCRGDASLMREIFMQSALAQGIEERKKGHVGDYLSRSISRIISKGGAVWKPDYHRDKAFSFPLTYTRGKAVFPYVCEENTAALFVWLGVRVKYNTLTKSIEVSGQGTDGLTLDDAITRLNDLCIVNGYKVSTARLASIVSLIAARHRYSPVCDYLETAYMLYGKEDGRDYIHELFTSLTLDPHSGQDAGLCERLLRYWLVGAVRIAFNTLQKGVKLQGVLILQGPQGIGKTRLLESLLPNPKWGQTGLTLDPTNKDDVMNAGRYWIVELGEIGSTIRKGQLDRLKQFFSNAKDSYRKPYGRSTIEEARTTAFYGTVNESGFLKDFTGERRYWVIAVTAINLPDDFDPLLLWGQVMALARDEHARHYLTSDEIIELDKQNAVYEAPTDAEIALRDKFNWDAPVMCWEERTATQIAAIVGPRVSPVTIGKVLRRMARLDPRVKIPRGHRNYRYLLPPLLEGTIQTFPLYTTGGDEGTA